MKIRVAIIFLFFSSNLLFAKEGKFINPITDVCWDCLFPITVSGVNVTPKSKEAIKYETRICTCKGIPPKIGIPLTFWEPIYLVDVTRHAYKLMGLGGATVGKESIKNRGSIGITADGPSQHSFYHVHFYTYPIMAFLELFTDFICTEKGNLDIGYMSEMDPLWNDDQLSAILNPESALFSSEAAQLACVPDCLSTNIGKPLDKLFWCAGCQGSLYPFTGTVAHHSGALQASSLLVHRTLAKLHRCYALKGYGEKDFCEAKYMPFIKKSIYKTQLVYPLPQTKGPCQTLGKSSILWGMGKTFPYGGEDFVYLIWRKKQCCLDAVKVATISSPG